MERKTTTKALESARRTGEAWLAQNPGESIEIYALEGGWGITHLELLTRAFDLQQNAEISSLLSTLRREKYGTRTLSEDERARLMSACDQDPDSVRGLRDSAILSLRLRATEIVGLTRESAPETVEMADWLNFWSGPIVFPVIHYRTVRESQSILPSAITTLLRQRAAEAGIADGATLSTTALRSPAPTSLHGHSATRAGVGGVHTDEGFSLSPYSLRWLHTSRSHENPLVIEGIACAERWTLAPGESIEGEHVGVIMGTAHQQVPTSEVRLVNSSTGEERVVYRMLLNADAGEYVVALSLHEAQSVVSAL